MGSQFAQNTTLKSYSLLSRHTHLSGICTYTKHSQSPPKNTPFPVLNLKMGKMNYCLGNSDPNWAKYLKSGQNFSRSGQKGYSYCDGVIGAA